MICLSQELPEQKRVIEKQHLFFILVFIPFFFKSGINCSVEIMLFRKL
jgi:hypothetical protein